MDGTRTAEDLMSETFQHRSIASEGHRLHREALQSLEARRGIPSPQVHPHRFLPWSNPLGHYVRAILGGRTAEAELRIRTGHVLHDVQDHLI